LRRIVWASVLLIAVMLGSAGVASAHAEYDRSDPADGATLAAAPALVQVWFTEELDTKQSTATVSDATGARADAGAVVSLDTADHKLLVITLKPTLSAGTYTVKWHSVSAQDGDADDGSFSFKVGAPTTTPPTTTPPATTPPTAPAAGASGGTKLPNTGRGLPAIAIAGAALVLLGGALVVGRRKR